MCLALAFKPCVPVKPAKSHLAFLSNTGVKWSIAVFNFGSFNTFRACSQFNWALTYVTTQSVRCAVLCCAVASCERSPQVCAIRCIRRWEVVHIFFIQVLHLSTNIRSLHLSGVFPFHLTALISCNSLVVIIYRSYFFNLPLIICTSVAAVP